MSLPRHLPSLWLPDCKMERIVIHWTAGGPQPSLLDKSHYHFLVAQDGNVHKGVYSVKANARPFRAIPGTYAAHALNFNAGAIGISLCGMAGATESPFRAGPYPIRESQWIVASQVAAECCLKYGIDPAIYAVCQHGEIEKRWGVKQKQKWDVCKLPWHFDWTHDQVERDFRLRVISHLKALKAGQ